LLVNIVVRNLCVYFIEKAGVIHMDKTVKRVCFISINYLRSELYLNANRVPILDHIVIRMILVGSEYSGIYWRERKRLETEGN